MSNVILRLDSGAGARPDVSCMLNITLGVVLRFLFLMSFRDD